MLPQCSFPSMCHTWPHAEWNSKILSLLDQVHIVTPPNSLSTLQPSRHSNFFRESPLSFRGKVSTGPNLSHQGFSKSNVTLLPLMLVPLPAICERRLIFEIMLWVVGHGIHIYNMSIEDDVTYLALYLQIIRHTLLIQYCCSIKNKASFPFPVEIEMMMMTTTTTPSLLCWHE